MAFLDKLDKKFHNWGIPHLTLQLIIGQSLIFILAQTGRINLEMIPLIPIRVLQGEVWRLLTFLLLPPTFHPIFIVFAWYMFYLMGSALEQHWGHFRYTVFVLIAYLATLVTSFITPNAASTNAYIGGSVFLAFAFLNPDFQLYIFFIFPVKIKWLALLTWVSYIWTLLVGNWTAKFLVLASVLNFLIFFGRDLWLMARSRRWRMERQAREFAVQNKPVHRCTVCGITDKDDHTMEFRYCTKCSGSPCYCREHIKNHEHLTA